MISILIATVSILTGHAEIILTAKVDSFVSTGRYTNAAELCGHIEGGITAAHQVLIVTDPKSKGPGKYVVLTLSTGEFCAVVSTAFGQADVTVIGYPSTPKTVYASSTK